MSTCTFFGHRECPIEIKEKLRAEIEKLILQGVDVFYVGHQGHFDGYAHSILKELSARYPHIIYTVILAYLPTERKDAMDYSDTMFPEGMESVPPRFAISHRNRWMLEHSDICVCYIHHTWGGAYQFALQAKRNGKKIINLGNLQI